MTFRRSVLREVQDALRLLGDPVRAEGARKYMKNIAPFLGVTTDARRTALRPIFRNAGAPTSETLGVTALALMGTARHLEVQPGRRT